MAIVLDDIRGWRYWVPLVLVLGVAAWLRVYDLGARPMHADEANQAVKLGALIEKGEYAFDPRDHHGPTLYYFSLIPAWLRGERTLAELSETTVRLTPAAFGVIGVALLAFATAPAGRGASLLAAVFLAISPAAVYYSRYFIQETLLVTFALAAFVAAQRWCETQNRRWAFVAGAGIGLMQATKASAPVFVLAAIAAWVVASRWRPADGGGQSAEGSLASTQDVRKWQRMEMLSWAGLGFGAVVLVFYSSFFTHAAGLRDALASYGTMSGRVATQVSGHEKPWWFYGGLFWRQWRGGYLWDQSLFLGLALAGVGWSLFSRNAFARGVAVYALLVGAALSLTPYKTPWVVVNLIPAMAVLAAVALIGAVRWRPWMRVPVTILFAAAVLWQGWQVRQAVFVRPADARNPFAYVHSVPDVLKIPELAKRIAPGSIKVISEEYWPLPWYLRKQTNVGYWMEVPDDCDAALVMTSAGLADEVRTRLRGTYQESYLGLRPGFVFVVFARQ